jgi:hypothetical protein
MKYVDVIRSSAALGAFLIYWSLTLVFVSPDNPIRIELGSTMNLFARVFSQRWGFFAPPPTGDLRIYYSFYDKVSGAEVLTVEALAPIVDAKRAAAPFNSDEEIMDYLLASSAMSLIELMSMQSEITKLNFPDEGDAFYYRETLRSIDAVRDELPPFVTLQNYAALLAAECGLDPAWHDFKLSLCFEAIPHVSEVALRRARQAERKAQLAFETSILPIPTTSTTP